MTWIIGRRLLGRVAGTLAAFLQAGGGYFIAYGSYIGTEGLGIVLMQLTVLSLLAEKPISGSRGFLAGCLFGAVTFVRVGYFLFVPVFFFWLILSRTTHFKGTVLFIVGFIVVFIPWTIRNHSVMGKWTPLYLRANQSLFLQRHPKLAEMKVDFHDPKNLASAFIRHPIGFSAALLHSPEAPKHIRNYWNYTSYQSDDFIHLLKGSSFSHVLHILEYGLFVLGAIILSRKNPAMALLFVLLIVYKCLLGGWSFYLTWHRFHLEFMMILFYVASLVWLARGLREAPVIGGPRRAS